MAVSRSFIPVSVFRWTSLQSCCSMLQRRTQRRTWDPVSLLSRFHMIIHQIWTSVHLRCSWFACFPRGLYCLLWNLLAGGRRAFPLSRSQQVSVDRVIDRVCLELNNSLHIDHKHKRHQWSTFQNIQKYFPEVLYGLSAWPLSNLARRVTGVSDLQS